MNNKVILIGAGLVGLWAISRAKAIKETVQFLKWEPTNVDLQFEGITPVITSSLRIFNPNKTSVPVNGIVGQLKFKGQNIASFTNVDKLIINGNESTTVTIKVRLNLLNSAIALFTKDPEKKVEIDGLIKNNVVDVPFGFGYDFTKKLFSKMAASVSGTHFIDAFNINRDSKNIAGIGSLRQTGSSNRASDRMFSSMAPGKRYVWHRGGKYTVYYERRKNRSDKGKFL